jgi:radical SAM protein with 4Fe4S-binding SPASM domain
MLADFQEVKFLLRNLSKRRFQNAWSLYRSFSKRSSSPASHTMPIALSVEPTTACNLGCPECPSGLKKFTRPTGNLKEDLLDDLLHEIGRDLIYLTFYFQGEPFIHPKMNDLIAKANEYGIFTATSTNAHFINERSAESIVKSGLNRLIISIDGTTQKVYEAYRKQGKLEKVIEGTKLILAKRKEMNSVFPRVYFQFLVVRPNEHQIGEVKQLGKQLGVDGVHFKTAQVYDYENGNHLIPKNERYSRYEQLANGKWKIKNPLHDQCWKMWHSAVVTWDGRVVPCCFDKDATHQMGQIGEQSFKDIWRGEAYANFRSALLRSRSEIEICKNCSEGTKVWA